MWIVKDAYFYIRTVKTLIGLRGCAGLFESALSICVRRYEFSCCETFEVFDYLLLFITFCEIQEEIDKIRTDWRRTVTFEH